MLARSAFFGSVLPGCSNEPKSCWYTAAGDCVGVCGSSGPLCEMNCSVGPSPVTISGATCRLSTGLLAPTLRSPWRIWSIDGPPNFDE